MESKLSADPHLVVNGFTVNPNSERQVRKPECVFEIGFEILPDAYAKKCKDLFAVISASFCLSEPAAAFLGFAKTFFPAPS